MSFKKVSTNLLKIWRARLIIICFLFALFTSLVFNFFTLVWNILTIAWVVAFLFFYSFYLPALYSSISYKLEGNILTVSGGVFFVRDKYIHQKNIQYVMSLATPLSRYYSLCSLIVVGAGGIITLAGLDVDEVLNLRTALTKEVAE